MALYCWLVQMADGGDTGPVGDIIVGGNICFVLVECFFDTIKPCTDNAYAVIGYPGCRGAGAVRFTGLGLLTSAYWPSGILHVWS